MANEEFFKLFKQCASRMLKSWKQCNVIVVQWYTVYCPISGDLRGSCVSESFRPCFTNHARHEREHSVAKCSFADASLECFCRGVCLKEKGVKVSYDRICTDISVLEVHRVLLLQPYILHNSESLHVSCELTQLQPLFVG
jgi:hypothetical protein